jgi:hypothetical protein
MNLESLPDEVRVQLRKRFLDDFAFWAKHCCKIRTKQGTIVPLLLNRVQRRFLEAILRQWAATGRVRFVVLKARQQGLSTVIMAFQYWWLSQHPANKGLVMAHEADSTQTLFDMYKRTHDNCPELLRPATKYSSKTELTFSSLDTGIRVATAGGRGVARGETLQTTHLSEVAFWPVAFASTNFNGLIQAVPNEDNTFAFIESTANGMSGKFFELAQGAIRGENEFELFFSGWNESEEYREPAPENFQRTPDEQKLAKAYDLDDDQLYWRRRKIAQNGLALFQQEYPLTAEEAFISTGRPVFNTEWVHDRLKIENIQQPVRRCVVTEGLLSDDVRGELMIYHDVKPGQNYVIGADVGMGLRASRTGAKDSDPSVAQVLDGQLRQVAVWTGIIHPDAFAKILTTLGYYFNSATIAPERNNHGLLTCVKLRDMNYPYIYTDVTEGALDDRDTINIGYYVTERTKPLIIDKLRAVLRDREMEVNDETTLREMLTFVVNESGKMGAEPGCHDDCIMSLAIANQIHEGKWNPIAVTDDYYVKAI